jgi:hypothetical protein
MKYFTYLLGVIALLFFGFTANLQAQTLTISPSRQSQSYYIGDTSGVFLDPNLVLSSTRTTTNVVTYIEIFIDDPSSPSASELTTSSNFETLSYDTSLLPDGVTGVYFLNTVTSPDVKMLRFTIPADTRFSELQTLLRSVKYTVLYGQQQTQKTIYIVVHDIVSPVKWAKQNVLPSGWPAAVTKPRGLRFYRIVRDTGYNSGWIVASSSIVASRNHSHYGLTNGYFASAFTADEDEAMRQCLTSSNIASNSWTNAPYFSATDVSSEGQWRWGNDPDGYENTLFSIGGVAQNSLFTRWGSGQPDDASGEDYGSYSREVMAWNDLDPADAASGSFVMYRAEDCTNKVRLRVLLQNSLLQLRPL